MPTEYLQRLKKPLRRHGVMAAHLDTITPAPRGHDRVPIPPVPPTPPTARRRPRSLLTALHVAAKAHADGLQTPFNPPGRPRRSG
jgi:hypothetical protein